MTTRPNFSAPRMDDYASALLPPAQPVLNGVLNGPMRALGTLGYGQFGIEDYMAAYLTNGIASRIIDLGADDATARGFDFTNDSEGAMAGEFRRLQVQRRVASGLRWAELLGGSALVIYTDDSRDMQVPLDEDNIGKILELRPVDLTSIKRYGNPDTDPNSPWFNTVPLYSVMPLFSGPPVIVHITRLIPFSGADLPDILRRGALLPWMGRSALSGVMDEILRYERMTQWSEKMLERKQQLVFMMEGMGKWLEETRDPETGISIGQQRIQDRVQMMDMVRGILATIVIDGGEIDDTGKPVAAGDRIQGIDLNMANVPQTLAVGQVNLAAKTGYPVTTLFGQTASGLSSSNAGDNENYYGKIIGLQHRVAPAVNRIVELLLKQKTPDKPLDQDTIVSFSSLWIPSQLEQAQTAASQSQANLQNAQAAQANVEAGIAGPEEMARWYAREGMFGLTEAEIASMLDEIARQKEAAVQQQAALLPADDDPPHESA